MNAGLVVAPVVLAALFAILWVATLLDRLVAAPAVVADLRLLEVGVVAEPLPTAEPQGGPTAESPARPDPSGGPGVPSGALPVASSGPGPGGAGGSLDAGS